MTSSLVDFKSLPGDVEISDPEPIFRATAATGLQEGHWGWHRQSLY